MSETVDWDPDQLVRAAERELRAGEWKAAVELLRRALNLDEAHARAHALLALALLVPGRTAGAEAEARRALQLDGSPYSHYVMAAALFARERPGDAWAPCHVALGGGLDRETEIAIHVLGAQIRNARGERDEARDLLDRAIHLAPTRLATRVAAARFELVSGRVDVAALHVGEALRASGTDVAANVIAGEIALRNDNVADADRHVQLALLQDSLDRDALRLWALIKSRKQRAIGWSWRALVWAATRDDRQQTGLLVGSFLVLQLLSILANAAGVSVQNKLVWIWLGFLVAMYWGPAGLQKVLEAELERVDRR